MEGERAEQGMSSRVLIFVGVFFLVAFALLFAHLTRVQEGSLIQDPAVDAAPAYAAENDPRDDPPAPPERTAILGGLKVGSKVAGWRVAALTISSKPEVKDTPTVLLTKGSKSCALWIAPKGKLKAPAPRETGAHAFYQGFFFETDSMETAAPFEQIVERVRLYEAGTAP